MSDQSTNWTPPMCITGMMPVEYMPGYAQFEKERLEREERYARDREVRTYFEALGYSYSSDHNLRFTWHEILDDKGLVCQIDKDVSIADIVQDFTAWHNEQDTVDTGKSYSVCAPKDCPRFKKLLATVARNQFGGIQQTLSL